ncbi:uncharacterized protein PV06_03080 [Exophiala oligosperma]|uniref:Peptidase S59 domain-containing protein n=1 Tax=Exophiala oligosperma TaxID=215243 RepID=A0A0D2E9K3_9EURO|nr:uncharacterized protein PV06_03080 [Exophiala oligosperma]KIW44624.1 hypothetical protein PV06_03080 [Exophiala oligosperma]
MSFGGGGFSFGSNTNTQNTGFGGFGNNTNSGFGTSTRNTGFGASTAASNPFGGGSGGSTFGSPAGGFGNNSNTSGSLFGNKPASNPFGTSTNTGGGLFGNSTTTQQNSGFGGSTGGFGNNASTGGFGGSTGGSSFSFGGANKPAFGASNSSTPLFGQGGTGTTGGFGGGAFGASGSGTALSNQPVPPSEGTASTPYAPTLEKDASNQQSNYQSINFMQPYQKYSFEELRLADYNAGRRYGSATGTSGGFGSSTFGGFGGSSSTPAFGGGNTSSGGLFGGQTTSSSTPFGGSGTQTSGFGGGGLFGSKPATGGLFGQQQSTGTSSGGLFGTASSTGGAFGGGNSGAFGSGTNSGGLFGQQQNKPGGLFGSTGTTATTSAPSFSFGNAAPTSGGTGPFGNNNQQQQQPQQQSGGLFGAANQQKPLFGGGSGGFGGATTQSQPSGGLFGTSTAQTGGGGLFGNNTATTGGTATGLFGSNNNTSNPGLFGGQAQKPGGLFSNSAFGTSQPSTGGGLFGTSGSNNQQGGGFSFGNAAQKPATNSLFGNSGTGQAPGLFSQTGGTSLFGNSQNAQQGQQQQPEFKQSSLNDPNPYGQTSIWTGLPVPTPETAKPLFTPLSATQKMRESQAKPPPSLRLSQSRYMTPPRRSGFGFSYSTYGTPNSAASTPGGSGLTNSMYGSRSFTGGSFGRSFGKSASASNLRSQFSGDTEGVLSPGAFAPSASRWSSGNMRRLTIDRSIRNDLFTRPSLPTLPMNGSEKPNGSQDEPIMINGTESSGDLSKLKKRVSFDKGTFGGQEATLNGESGALVRTETDGEDSESGRTLNGSATPEAESSRTNELAMVPEDRESDHVSLKKAVQAKPDPQPGDYWMKPSRAELGKMPREKLQKFVGFEVGRKGCGKVTFNGAVDLTAIPLDDLYEKIVEIRLRSVTVYPDASSKPPVGKGLNVPSTISIENSWPRSRGQPSSATSGPIFDKHVNRLKKMHGTEFVNYEVSTGVWTFRVPHYTRYGLDYDEDEDLSQSQMSAPPDSLSASQSGNMSEMDVDSEDQDDSPDEDDTFAFKQKTVPGGFGRRSAIDYDVEVPIAQSVADFHESELSEESAAEESDNEVSMVGSFPPRSATILESPSKPILKASQMGTPGKHLISLDGDWAEQLQRTISPRKQNREALRDVQNKILLDRAYEPIKPKAHNKNEFRTSIDIMNSLFSKHEARMAKGKKGQAGPDFEFPYSKRAKTFDDHDSEMTENDKLWHLSFKPQFTQLNKLVYKVDGAVQNDASWTNDILMGNEGGDVAITSLRSATVATSTETLMANTKVKLVEKVPFVQHDAVDFSQAKDPLAQQGASEDEIDVYRLSHVLFDEFEDEFTRGLSRQQQREFLTRIRKDRLSKFLAEFVWRRHAETIKAAEKASAATAAILQLTAHNLKAACEMLTREHDFHLSLLVAQIGQADAAFQNDMADQIESWRQQGVLSEMSEEIRGVYELLAGNTTIAQGKQKVPVEDKASTFALSEKFELDWVQAFCLCLWYGRQKHGDIADAVSDFADKVATHEESASPIGEDGKEDLLWVMLKLFASKEKPSSVEAPVFPQALSALAQPWNSAHAFRLHHFIAAAVRGVKVDNDKADDLAMSLMFEYSAKGDILGAIYAAAHISGSATRGSHIRELLNRHAAVLPSSPDLDSDEAPTSQAQQAQPQIWKDLTTHLKVPVGWICHAKALYSRSSSDAPTELTYLILAREFAEAHECLLKRVAPRLVIDEDWDTLQSTLAKFGPNPADKLGIGEWESGGQVYADFVSLMAAAGDSMLTPGHQQRRGSAPPQEAAESRRALLLRLRNALIELNARFVSRRQGETPPALDKDKENLEQRVALCEMGRAVARAIESDEDQGLSGMQSILDLPLTADVRLTHARTLGVEYYRGVMAMAR